MKSATKSRPRSAYRDDLIRGQMAALRITSEKLSVETGLSRETISRARNGENLSVDTLSKIASALRLSLSALFKTEAA